MQVAADQEEAASVKAVVEVEVVKVNAATKDAEAIGADHRQHMSQQPRRLRTALAQSVAVLVDEQGQVGEGRRRMG